jgi:hypothetical protein
MKNLFHFWDIYHCLWHIKCCIITLYYPCFSLNNMSVAVDYQRTFIALYLVSNLLIICVGELSCECYYSVFIIDEEGL